MEKVQKFKLELTLHEVIILEANLEVKIKNKERLHIPCKAEKAFLRKVKKLRERKSLK